MSSTSPLDVGLTLGALYVGLLFSIFLFGIATLQSYRYFAEYPKDTLALKCLVSTIWVLDAIHCALISHSVYYYTIQNYFNPKVLSTAVWSLDLQIALSNVVGCTCQAYFIFRVWVLGRSYLVTGVCALVTLTWLALGMVVTYSAFHDAERSISLWEKAFGWGVRSGLSLPTAADVCISASLIFYLFPKRHGLTSTNRLIKRILIFTIETCLITSSATIVDVICFASMNNFVYMGVYFVSSKLYVNALLASLNVRKDLRANYAVTPISRMQLTAPGSANIHSSFPRSPANGVVLPDQIDLKSPTGTTLGGLEDEGPIACYKRAHQV
ncbi:hypothetical protein PUNSTDRAFT_138466 [Punctularia strigosozonata HHB-11173 SS5]|uniref:DUF6534 domain-containing protein n=1 Tax=Punctularia strigosozonata (strain HHB-11173) TaxID=741275 RepID=R7S3H9_PUNST|nr:uncharacterized protein PUNSTDRAFT_138466 [Punctularia strigosozonata HHB-11173 SS5]EIN04424.1 hypothetical protein PUNSTDRAFT_138466 [Punctularia strigosozonata HHB-11173 SS5]